ncbi:hypothetical protein C8R46DRAFT_466922 [Mycena filopes]|nr:hypothetical protein C8R46DRAFT_466922 [Mycena filopes]
MERTLRIPEVLCVVFEYFDPSDFASGKTSATTLAALARTCKAFQDPALDVLWRFQVDLVPALRLFPEDLWDRRSQGNSNVLKFVALRRPLNPADWKAPLAYWPRIKTFRISSFDLSTVSLEVCESLRFRCPNRVLFPNVREVSWEASWYNRLSTPVLSILLSGRLQRIRIGGAESPPLFSLIYSLGSGAPDLTHVDLRGSNAGIDILPSVETLLSKLKRLESLFLLAANATIFQRAAGMPQLKCLVVDKVLPFGPLSLDNVPRPHFPSLEIVNLWSTTPGFATTLIASIQHHALKTVNLLLSGGMGDDETADRLYTALAAGRTHSALHTLRIELSGQAAEPITADTLRILLPFTHLRHLELRALKGFNLTDALVAELARTWTRVEDLSLGTLSLGYAYPRVTLAGVHTLARHCPRLRALELLIDATAVPELDEDDVWAAQERLAVLRVDGSPITAPADVATFLAQVFPGLQEVESKDEGWKRVDRFLKAGTRFAHDDESAAAE